MWKTLFESVRGVSHEKTGQPCQDSCLVTEMRPPKETFLLLACADGAGSSELSHIGSRLACDTFIRHVGKELQDYAAMPQVTPTLAAAWFRVVHEELNSKAQELGTPLRQLATTLLGAVIGEERAAFLQIGDGAIVTLDQSSYQYVFWPQAGEYVNTTYFVTDENFETHLEFTVHEKRVDEIALFTDGLQMLALDFRERLRTSTVLAPMFQTLRANECIDDLIVPMRAFLNSPQLNDRTDDDKTLVLATRVSSDAPAL